MEELVSIENSIVSIKRIPNQEMFEMFLLKWISMDELKEYIISYYNNESNKDISNDEKFNIWNTCMQRAQQVIMELEIKGFYHAVKNSDLYKSLHKANDKPTVSGQPRRFTKAFIPFEYLLDTFMYDASVSKATNIKELEDYVDSKYSKLEILRAAYIHSINSMYVSGDISNYVAGAGVYDDLDAWKINNIVIGSSFWDIYQDITKEDVGILF